MPSPRVDKLLQRVNIRQISEDWWDLDVRMTIQDQCIHDGYHVPVRACPELAVAWHHLIHILEQAERDGDFHGG